MQLAGHPVIGMSWEGFVLENIINHLPWRSTPFFYRTAKGAEIDLIVENGDGTVWAIEIKRSLSAKVRKGFYTAYDDIKPDRAFVVHSGDDRYPLSKNVEAISLYELINEMQKNPADYL